MISWILIFLVAVIVIIVSIKFKELKHKVVLGGLIVLLLVFFVTGGYVYFKSHASLSSYDGFVAFGKAYFSWVGSAVQNTGKISGYALNQGWGVNATLGK